MTRLISEYKNILKESIIAKKGTLNEMKAYHASDYNFNKFDVTYHGKGQGHPSHYGMGVYVTTDKDTALFYGTKYLYVVDIPDDNGKNYLNNDDNCNIQLCKFIVKYIFNACKYEYSYSNDALATFKNDLLNTFIESKITVDDLVGTVSLYLDNDQIKDMLNKFGIIGIKYDKNNIVVFNDEHVEIVDKIVL